MKFTSTKGMTNETAPECQVLVQYLEPSWGSYNVEFAIGYFDNPNDCGTGWKMWLTDNPIKVIAYAVLEGKLKSKHESETQKEFHAKYGAFPDFGSVGE